MDYVTANTKVNYKTSAQIYIVSSLPNTPFITTSTKQTRENKNTQINKLPTN